MPPPPSDKSTRGSYYLRSARTWSSYPNKCDICKKTSTTILDYKQHYESNHGKFCGFKCADCGVNKIPYFDRFVQHVREHRPELSKNCPICGNKIKDPNHIKNYRTETCSGQKQHSKKKEKLNTAKRAVQRSTAKKPKKDIRPEQRAAGDLVPTTAFADNCDYNRLLPAPHAAQYYNRLLPAPHAAQYYDLMKQGSPVNEDAGDEVLHHWADIFLAHGHRL